MKSRSKELLDRAIAATVAAIEIYNKPDFPYRSETFCILAINGWELLLKAKWLKENGNNIRSLYVMETRTNKDGTKSKRHTVKLTRSKNPYTLGLDYLSKKLVEQRFLDQKVVANIEALHELRDSSVHFYYQTGTDLALVIQEVGAACLKNFVLAVKEWFAQDLSNSNFYLMPLSFLDMPLQSDVIFLKKREERNFWDYLQQLEASTGKSNSDYQITANIGVNFIRSKAKDAMKVQVTTDSDATKIYLTEEQILEKYPWDYKQLTDRCRQRYSGFKLNSDYHVLRKSLYGDKRYCHLRYLDPDNPNSSKKWFFNPNILQEFNKHYSQRP